MRNSIFEVLGEPHKTNSVRNRKISTTEKKANEVSKDSGATSKTQVNDLAKFGIENCHSNLA